MSTIGRIIKAQKVLADFRGGSSLPVLVETTDGRRVVLKWKCTAEGPSVIATDWICLRLAAQFGINVPSPVEVLVTPELARPGMDPDITDLINRSIGVNLGLTYLPNASVYRDGDDVTLLTREMIFLFDLLLLNIDRTDKNPNMLTADGKLFCIDYSAAMSVKMLIEDMTITLAPMLALLRRHPFYSPEPNLTRLAETAAQSSASEGIDELPEEWLAETERTRIKSGLAEILLHAGEIVAERLELLRLVEIESDEAFRARAMQNRLALEETVKRLTGK